MINMNTDYILIRSAKDGNTKAAESIIRKYYANIFDYCRYHSADIHTAEDLTQEVFLTLLKEINQYRHNGKLLNYLYTIARNKCIDEKKRMRNMEISIDRVMSKIDSNNDDCGEEIEYLDAKAAVDRLPDDIREIIVLYFFLDRKQKEIAEICGIGLPLVKYRLRKGKAMIKELLEGEV